MRAQALNLVRSLGSVAITPPPPPFPSAVLTATPLEVREVRGSDRILSGLMAALGLAAAPVAADIALVSAAADGSMFSETGEFANGAGDFIFAGQTDRGDNRRALIRFDAAAAVPAGSIVTGVTLTLHMSRTNTGPQVVSLHRALASWTEGATDAPGEEGSGWPAEPGDVSWTHRTLPDLEWATTGGEFDPVPTSTIFVGGVDFYEWSGASLISDVSAWLADPGANFGWILVGDETFTTTAKRFDSRTNPNESFRPVLRIEYTSIPAPGVSSVILAAAAAALTRRPIRGRRPFVE